MKISVMDIGSNSVRLMIMSDGKTLLKTLDTTRLGEKIADNGVLWDEAIDRTLKAVLKFKRLSEAEGVEKIYAFATAAVRSTENGNIFVDKVKKACGLNIDVISGEEEANIGLAGVVGENDGGILDVGGASSELTFRADNKLLYSKSLDIGAVSLFDICGRNAKRLSEYIDKKIKEYGDIRTPVKLYGIGGTATSLAAVKLKLKTYDPNKVNGCVIKIEEVGKLAERLLVLTSEKISDNYCVPLRRAEIIGGGSLLIYKIMDKIHADEITISESDNLEGYVKVKGLQ